MITLLPDCCAPSIGQGNGSEKLSAAIREYEFPQGRIHVCRVLLCPEECGGYSVHAIRLPGVVSQGDSVEEAVANITEAFQGAIATYEDLGIEVPWGDAEVDFVPGSFVLEIEVNV